MKRPGKRPAEAEGMHFDRSLGISTSVAAVILFVPLFVPALTGRVFTVDDLSVFHLPLRYLFSTALAEGHSFVWTPMLFGGFYVHAEGQVGMFHPAHWLLYRALPLGPAFNIELIASYAFSFAGMWLLLRRFGLHPAARTIGSISFTFSGFNLLHLCQMNAVAIVAHVPWLLLAIDHAAGEERRHRLGPLGAIALLIGSQVLLGYPQYVWISALACAVYAVVKTTRLSRLLPIAAAAVVGLAVGGIQLMPTMDLLARSARTNLPSDFPFMLSLHPLNVLQLWAPYVFPYRAYAQAHELYVHELGVYNGAFSTLAVVWVVVAWRHIRYRRPAAAAGILCALGSVLALGKHAVVYEALTMLPIVSKFRAPARHLVLLHLGLAIAAAIAFDGLVDRAKKRTRPLPLAGWIWLPMGLSVSTTVAAVSRPDWFITGPDQAVVVGFVVVGTVLFALTTLVFADAIRGSRAGLVMLPFVLAVDLGLWGYSYNWGDPPRAIHELAAGAERPPAPASSVHTLTGDRKINLLLLENVKVLRPYVGLPPARTLAWDDPNTARLAGVEWILTREGWTRVANPAPRVRMTGGPGGTSARAELVVDEPGRMEVQVDAGEGVMLATTESYHDDWKARAAGRDLGTLRHDGDFLGVALEPGQYRVNLTFEPRSLRHGAYVSLGGLFLAGLLIAGPAWRRVFKV